MKKTIINLLTPLLAVLSFSLSAQALNVGDKAPCVVLEGLEATGQSTTRCIREPQDTKKSTRYTVVKYFSVFCGACERMHETFFNLARSNPQLFQNVSINYIGRDSERDLRSYARQEKISLSALSATVFMDTDRDVKRTYDFFSTPTFLVLDRKNNFEVVYKHIGIMSQKELRSFLSAIQ